MLAFILSEYAETVYAIEPISSFRNFIKNKATAAKINNVYAIDGFLHAIPFPDSTFDYLFTSNAIGWHIEKELVEIERVVKTGGQAIHIMRVNEHVSENPAHDILISKKWNYQFKTEADVSGLKLKYWKLIV
jgi:ubiquinone/menaquinone biosynthesis C-methylase UbiE